MKPLSFVKMNANNKTEIRFIKLSLSHSRAPQFPFKLRLAEIFSDHNVHIKTALMSLPWPQHHTKMKGI